MVEQEREKMKKAAKKKTKKAETSSKKTKQYPKIHTYIYNT